MLLLVVLLLLPFFSLKTRKMPESESEPGSEQCEFSWWDDDEINGDAQCWMKAILFIEQHYSNGELLLLPGLWSRIGSTQHHSYRFVCSETGRPLVTKVSIYFNFYFYYYFHFNFNLLRPTETWQGDRTRGSESGSSYIMAIVKHCLPFPTYISWILRYFSVSGLTISFFFFFFWFVVATNIYIPFRPFND